MPNISTDQKNKIIEALEEKYLYHSSICELVESLQFVHHQFALATIEDPEKTDPKQAASSLIDIRLLIEIFQKAL